MGERKPQINVAVNPERKETWERVVEEDGRFSSMSQLIRTAVSREISGSHDNTNDSGKDVAELKDRIESLENTIQGMGSDFQELKGIIQAQTPTNQNLRSEVFAALPETEIGSHKADTPEEVAAKIGGPVDAESVSDVLDELAAETGQVESFFSEEDGERTIRYSKKGDSL
ncbi:hypothetical protein [Halobellus rarus]|uniref:CopG family transcriptional regulator n=1 Tax=Halobellus rarus TaxID=1126237 RepID=A0ABD6CM11_9EURY|nr:hypothetical protein [Halobellus rarus]